MSEAEQGAFKALDKLYEENGDALKRLAEVEKEEIMTENERIKVIQTACSGINKYLEALKALAETEKVEVKQKLEELKKKNFQLVADACMETYKEKYGELPNENEYWRFLVSDYCATGEGRTISILCTQANPYGDDFPSDGMNKYVPITTIEYRAVREFHEYFGTWSLYGIDFLSREDFFEKYANFLPAALVNLKDKQCFLAYHGELHFNFS